MFYYCVWFELTYITPPDPFFELCTFLLIIKDFTTLFRLADYGISRPTLPTGAKGFGGTEGFMAPEIVKYNGEEEYTEKVDCFRVRSS